MFKTFKNWKWAALPMLLVGVAVALFAFKKDNAFSRMSGSPALEMSYAVEQVTIKKYNNAEGTCYQGIEEASNGESYDLNFSMSDAGEFEMTIKIGDSPQDLSSVGFEEPNALKVRKVLVNNSTMTTYDGNGQVLDSQPNKGDALSMQSIKNIALMSSQEFFDAVRNASMTGGTLQGPNGETAQIQQLKDGLVRLVSDKEICLIDMNKGVIQAITALENGNVTMERLIDSERDSQGAFVLRTIQDISYDQVPNSNAVIATTTVQNFKNFRLVDHNGRATLGGK